MFSEIASLASAYWGYEYQFKPVQHELTKTTGFFGYTVVVSVANESHGFVDDDHSGSPSSVD
jgi:hypothetical protein